jgi:2-isopropylmalate synthase
MQASVMSYEERNLSQGNDAEAIAIIELSVSDLPGPYYAVVLLVCMPTPK